MSLQSLFHGGINETKEGLGMNTTEYFCISESIIMDHMGRNIGGERGVYDEEGGGELKG